jgi:hypothetical protein
MQAEISLNTETSPLRQKFRLHAMFCEERTRAMHRPGSGRLVADPEGQEQIMLGFDVREEAAEAIRLSKEKKEGDETS